jgi:hypothetical protein
MGKKASNPNPPEGVKRPDPPPPPPARTFYVYWFGERETNESIRAGEDYKKYMEGWSDGFTAGLTVAKSK